MSEEKMFTQEELQDDYIDLGRLLRDMWKGLKRFWVMGAILAAAGFIAGAVYAYVSYDEIYDAYATFTITDSVSAEQTSSDVSLANQMGQTFMYIVNSGVLRNVVARDLGVSWVSSQILAEPVSNTNMLTIHVRDRNPQTAYDVLVSVMENYPEVAEYIIGSTQLNAIDISGVPEYPESYMQWKKYAVFGGLGGIAVFCCMIFVYAVTRKTVSTSNEIEQYVGGPFLTAVPMVMEKKRSGRSAGVLINKKNADQGFVEAVRLLANRIEHEKSKQEFSEKKVYLVTSALAGEGKTTIAVNLALMLAQRKYKVLLIDSDMRKPAVAQLLGITKVSGHFADFLKGKSSWKDTVQKNKRLPLYILPGMESEEPDQETGILSGGKMKELMEKCREEFDFVIMDTPPAFLFADASIIASQADGAVLVIKQDFARMSEIIETSNQLEDTGVWLTGCVLNGASRGEGGYGNGYGYGYGYGYGKKYGYGKRYGYGEDGQYGLKEE